MDTRQVTAAVRALRGAPASIFLALSVTPGEAFEVQQLVTLTGYSVQGVSGGLRVLETLGLVQSQPQYHRWKLVAARRGVE